MLQIQRDEPGLPFRVFFFLTFLFLLHFTEYSYELGIWKKYCSFPTHRLRSTPPRKQSLTLAHVLSFPCVSLGWQRNTDIYTCWVLRLNWWSNAFTFDHLVCVVKVLNLAFFFKSLLKFLLWLLFHKTLPVFLYVFSLCIFRIKCYPGTFTMQRDFLLTVTGPYLWLAHSRKK